MKTRHLLAALFLVISLGYSLPGNSQGVNSLFVAAMPGFPDLPQDSAYESQTYTYDIFLINNTSLFINSTIAIEMRVDSITSTILTNPQTAIAPGDSITISVPFYNFTQPQFKMGNNIVVVWPVVNGLVVQVDSFVTNVFFIPLNNLSEFSPSEPSFHMYPIPSTDDLHVDFNDFVAVEYVRIYDISGQLVKQIPSPAARHIDISFLAPGLYFLEVESNGKSNRRKFLKQ